MPRSLKFSERIGAVTPREVLMCAMTEALRNELWNLLRKTVLLRKRRPGGTARQLWNYPVTAVRKIWSKALYRSLDDLPKHEINFIGALRHVYFDPGFRWHQVFDLLEFVTDNYEDLVHRHPDVQDFRREVNALLEEHRSVYRFIGDTLAPISSEHDIASIEESLKLAQEKELLGAAIHLRAALAQLGKRPEPNYRNSIKESISAVESVVKQLTGVRGGGLDTALTKLDEKVHLHPAFKQGLIKLYGYTSDADGIRHALLDEPNIGYHEAKYMLVACSAFVNFLIAKASASVLLPVT